MMLNVIIGDFMTKQPITIEDNKSIIEAQELMKKYNIRHLPVTADGKVHAVLSEKDIKSVMGAMAGPGSEMRIKYICHERPYLVDAKTPLIYVLRDMAKHHYGCALVTHLEELVGIFTTIDACRYFAEMLEQRNEGAR